ncbi:MAG: hypothetical protein IJ795_03945, partial [Bacteroidales bacterium]|nr:hypothetical protein [Bacteroidales bacterium]
MAFAILSTICLWMGIPQELYAQNIIDGTYLPPEPQSTGMLQYGGQQPALYTGAVSAEIPVYVYTDPDFTIPISLTYSYSGYMPGIPANYVGLGWSLNAGGCISRRVRGVKDECDLGNVLGYKVASDRRDWSDLSNLQDIITKDGMPTIHSGHDYYETTSDIYMYSFLGHSGKFVIDRRGIATVYDSSDPHGIISVDLSQLCHQRFQSKISIETGDGYRYEFGGHLTQSAQDDNIDCAVTYTPASPMGTYDRNSDEWYLTKIVAPNGRVATFTYRLGEGCMTKSVMPTANNKTFFTYTGTSTGFPFHFDGGESISSGISNSYGYLITEKSIAQLETVSITGGGAMTFSYESRLPERGKPNTALPVNLVQPDRLKSIVVSDASSNILASTILSYKYTSQANSANPVLLLSAIQNLDGEYKLSYYNESAAFPLQGSPAIDHWGYWNANSDEDISSVLPEASLDNQYRETITGTSRNPSSAKAISGMLRKIEYPTGGWTLFEYEPNRYRKEIVRNSTPQSQGVPVLNSLSSIKTGAGMRLKALEDYSSQNQSYRTEYIYEDATGLCSGIMLNMPRYYKAYKTEGASTNGLTVILSSNNQGCEIDGVNVEYSHVQVIHADGSKTMNSFSTYEDYPDS